jgi:hypothetical protein
MGATVKEEGEVSRVQSRDLRYNKNFSAIVGYSVMVV